MPAALLLCALAVSLAAPVGAHAATMTFGSPLTAPASADTAANLGYRGTDIPTIDPGPPARAVVVHVSHDGADTALWPESIGGKQVTAPAAGQVVSVALKGCAEPAAGATRPLTQIHFQDRVPQAGGGYRVNVTTQAFDLPVCGERGAGGAAAGASTVSTYAPTNFCVARGDAVAFNDEGGFNPNGYPSGVAYRVLGRVASSSTYSFIRNNGTNNGAVFQSSDLTPHDGFLANHGLQLLLRSTLATGSDATPLCPGGTHGQPGERGGPPALVLHPQTNWVDKSGWTSLGMYCARVASPCTGAVSVVSDASGAARVGKLGASRLLAQPHSAAAVRVHLSPRAVALVRSHNRSLPARLVVRLSDGTTASQAITLRI